MRNKTRSMVQGAVIAALYVILTHLQNFIFPDSASMAIQFRASEALSVLALFTPAAIPGLTIGCLLFNVTSGQALPLDFLIGSLGTFGAAGCMCKMRNWTIKGCPLPGLLMPPLWNGLLVGAELCYYMGGGFLFNSLCVAIGELVVMLTLGILLFGAVKARRRHFGL